jgi:hypothetical protein
MSFPVDERMGTFLQLYSNPSVGWHSAAAYAAGRKSIPVPLSGKNHWVFKAYLYCLNPKAYGNRYILEAMMLAHAEMKGVRDVVESLLLTRDMGTAEIIASKTGIPRKTIEAYESLFFSISDRKKDSMYLRNLVYPDSRLVEMFDGYSSSEDIGMLLKRFGYNHSGAELLFLSGFLSDFEAVTSTQAAAGKLENVLMQQGFLLTKLGFGNQTHNAQAIYHARSVIAATKQGGQENNADELPMSTVSELLYTTFRDESRERAGRMLDHKADILYKETVEV